MNKLMQFNIQLFAHKKGQSSTSNGRDSAGRRLGAKASDGEYVTAGSIIYRQQRGICVRIPVPQHQCAKFQNQDTDRLS